MAGLNGSGAVLTTKDERDELVRRYRGAREVYNRAMDEHAAGFDLPLEIGIDDSSDAFVDTEAYRRARGAVAEMEEIEALYFRRLPRLAMAGCPHCGKALFRAFDPFGLEGFWWRSDAAPEEALACPHFCVMQGAVDLRSCAPRPGFDVHPGPGAPFVVPRLLEMEGMVAVVSEVRLMDGAVAYPIAYFAARRPPAQLLAAGWARTSFLYTTQLGLHGWRRADEPAPGVEAADSLDFALEGWAARGKLRWCDPGGDGTALSTASACPFLNLGGVRHPQLIPAAATES